MTKIKIAVAILALVAATVAPSFRLIRAENLLGWSAQPVVSYACDPANTSGCGG
jgi:hypothetical protein